MSMCRLKPRSGEIFIERGASMTLAPLGAKSILSPVNGLIITPHPGFYKYFVPTGLCQIRGEKEIPEVPCGN